MSALVVNILVTNVFATEAISIEECANICPRNLECWQYAVCKKDCAKLPYLPGILKQNKDRCLVQLGKELGDNLLEQNAAKVKKDHNKVVKLEKAIEALKDNIKIIAQ